MIKIFFKLFILCGVFAMLLVAYNAFKSITGAATGQIQPLQGNENPSAVVTYGRKAMATAMEFANPILKKLGVDVQDKWTEDNDPITQYMDDANKVVEDAFKKMGN